MRDGDRYMPELQQRRAETPHLQRLGAHLLSKGGGGVVYTILWAFVTNPWSLFDLVVIIVSVFELVYVDFHLQIRDCEIRNLPTRRRGV